MSVVNAVILYTTVFPEKGHERQCHKKIQYEISPSTCAAIVGQLCRSSVGWTPVTPDIWLKGKHFAISKQPKRSCVVCAYEKNANGKYKKPITVESVKNMYVATA